jgi:HlyD family secretion protein
MTGMTMAEMRAMAGWVALAAIAGMSGCSKPDASAVEAAAPVEVKPVLVGTIERVIPAEGLLYPIHQSSITPKISAPVREFLVNRGDHVKQGQVVAVLENRDLSAAVGEAKSLYEQAETAYRNVTAGSLPVDINKAESDVAAAKEALNAAKKVYESRLELFKQGALARRLVDEANVAYAQAQSQYAQANKQLQTLMSVGRTAQTQSAQDQLDAAKARYEAAEAQLSYSEIRSPVSGLVADRPLYPGEMASAGSPLMTVMDVSRVIAKVNVAQKDAAELRLGMRAVIHTAEGQTEGKVTVISPAVNANSTTVEVWVEGPNPGEKLKPGGAARVEIYAGAVPNALLVPATALLATHEGEMSVMVAGEDNLAHERKVEVGIRNEEQAQILSGLKAGEKVIVAGGIGLEDGAKIRIRESGAGVGGGREGAAKDDR